MADVENSAWCIKHQCAIEPDNVCPHCLAEVAAKTTMDEEQVKALVELIMAPIRAHFTDGPPSKNKAYDCLNALAICSAYVVAGTMQSGDMRGVAFFNTALNNQVQEILATQGVPHGNKH